MERKNMNAIVKNKAILGGKPRLRHTRMSVEVVNSYLSCGYSIDDIKKDHPYLSVKQIKAAMDYLDNNLHKERTKLETQTY